MERYLGSAQPLGRRLRVGQSEYLIVGVVRNSLYESFGEGATPIMHFSYRDRPLSAGEIHLLRRGQVLDVVVWVVLAFVFAYTVAVTRGAAIDPSALAERLPSGKEVFGDGTAAYRLPQVISIPSYVILVAGAAWSAWRMRGRPEVRSRFIGTLLVAAGATITAVAGSAFAAVGNLPAFSISLLAGVAVMFFGFRRASESRPASQRRDLPAH